MKATFPCQIGVAKINLLQSFSKSKPLAKCSFKCDYFKQKFLNITIKRKIFLDMINLIIMFLNMNM